VHKGRGKSSYSEWSHDDLREWRGKIGSTQAQMAKELGVSHRQYCYYESGHTPIDMSLELAVRYLHEKKLGDLRDEITAIAGVMEVTPKPQGTLTPFQKERISRLMNAIHNYPASNLDEKGQKILSQCVDEISMLTSHLSEA